MKTFADLYNLLDQTNSINEKVNILADYFQNTSKNDKIFALALLCGRRPKRTILASFLRKWAAEQANLPDWLFEESYHTVGDLAETIALLTQQSIHEDEKSLSEWIFALKQLEKEDEETKKSFIINAWESMDYMQRFVFNKLITGGFRVGVSQKLVEKSLAKVLNMDAAIVAHRLTGNWSPFDTDFDDLLLSENSQDNLSKPYPFFLAYSLDEKSFLEWQENQWQAEWKWDGIRGQLICRGGNIYLWSRGEELLTEKFPEFHDLPFSIPDGVVIDGEIVCFKDEKILPFQNLQTRISRKNLSKKILEANPAVMIAYDLLEFKGKDIRELPISERRTLLDDVVKNSNQTCLLISPLINFQSWEELLEIRKNSRAMNSEGIMLKKLDSSYQVGRKRGSWWKWKVDPMSVDAVLIYAMKGHGRRANLYSDYTFAVWNNDGQLVTFTKAYSGLADEEIKAVDSFVKNNTIEKFGPVRSVKPELVFEIGFEGIQKSSRHKSGIALRFPRMLRWRKDKKAEEADRLSSLEALIEIDN